MHEISTLSPTCRPVTAAPTSATVPTASWPRIRPSATSGTSPPRMCRSVPQIVTASTRTITSVVSTRSGSGTTCQERLPGPWYTNAFMAASVAVSRGPGDHAGRPELHDRPRARVALGTKGPRRGPLRPGRAVRPVCSAGNGGRARERGCSRARRFLRHVPIRASLVRIAHGRCGSVGGQHLDRAGDGLDLLLQGDGDGQDAVLVGGDDLVLLRALGQAQAAGVRPVAELGVVPSLVPLRALGADGQDPVKIGRAHV